MRGLLIAIFCMAFAAIAMGQEAVVEPVLIQSKGFIEQLGDGSFLAKLVAFGAGIQIMLYGLATGLLKISDYTDTKWDNKAAAYLSQAAWFLGAFLGKFGYSVPKPILEEKAKEIASGD